MKTNTPKSKGVPRITRVLVSDQETNRRDCALKGQYSTRSMPAGRTSARPARSAPTTVKKD